MALRRADLVYRHWWKSWIAGLDLKELVIWEKKAVGRVPTFNLDRILATPRYQ